MLILDGEPQSLMWCVTRGDPWATVVTHPYPLRDRVGAIMGRHGFLPASNFPLPPPPPQPSIPDTSLQSFSFFLKLFIFNKAHFLYILCYILKEALWYYVHFRYSCLLLF